MRQPIIDPDKVNAWSESMRGAFAGSDFGAWLIVGFTVAFLLLVTFSAWRGSHPAKHR